MWTDRIELTASWQNLNEVQYKSSESTRFNVGWRTQMRNSRKRSSNHIFLFPFSLLISLKFKLPTYHILGLILLTMLPTLNHILSLLSIWRSLRHSRGIELTSWIYMSNFFHDEPSFLDIQVQWPETVPYFIWCYCFEYEKVRDQNFQLYWIL